MQNLLPTGIQGFTLRRATPEDTALILQFIRELALYEKMENDVIATEQGLYEQLFEKNHAEVLIGEHEGQPAAFALYFHSFSTFLGRANLYLEDLFVRKQYRGCGYGKAIFRALATLALERGCARMDWMCLNWNEASIAFYKKMGAFPVDDWTVYRLDKDALTALAQP